MGQVGDGDTGEMNPLRVSLGKDLLFPGACAKGIRERAREAYTKLKD